MVADRCTTLCLMMTCANFYPQYLIPMQLLATLDISSHWYQMYRFVFQRLRPFCARGPGLQGVAACLVAPQCAGPPSRFPPRNPFSSSSSLLKGKTSHKMIDLSESPMLRWYYWKVRASQPSRRAWPLFSFFFLVAAAHMPSCRAPPLAPRDPQPALFWLCSANELFFMAIYFHHFDIGWKGQCRPPGAVKSR